MVRLSKDYMAVKKKGQKILEKIQKERENK